MFCLNNTDTIEGNASVASKVDYTIHGFVSGSPAVLASGQLSDSAAVLYTATAATHVISITLVNTHTSSLTVDLYYDPTNAGTPRRMIPKTVTLQANYSLFYDGQRFMVIDSNGGIMSGGSVSDEAYGSSWDGVTGIAPSKNAVYDQMQLQMLKTGSNLAIGSDADGDMYYRASSALARLAKGTANFKMFMNAAGTAPEWEKGIKIVSSSRDISLTGTQIITGAGFKPSAIIVFGAINGNKASFGFSDFSIDFNTAQYGPANWDSQNKTISAWVDAYAVSSATATPDADGVTLTWSTTGSPTGTFTFRVMFLR